MVELERGATAVAKVEKAMEKRTVKPLQTLIQESLGQLQHALPRHMTAEKLARIALTCLRVNPKLMEAAERNPTSFLAALFQSAHLGLEPNLNGEAWLIPYNNRRKDGQGYEKVVQFQVGVYGWAKLFYNHQNSVILRMDNVHENDHFDYDLGTGEVHHKMPPFGKPRGEVVGYYAQAGLTTGGKILKVMAKPDAIAWAKRYSKCWDKEKQQFIPGTPWRDHTDSMGQVTVLKQVLKLVPKSPEIQRAVAMDETTKSAVDADMLSIPDETVYEVDDVDEPQNRPEPEQPQRIPVVGPATSEVPKPPEPFPPLSKSEEEMKAVGDLSLQIKNARSASHLHNIGAQIDELFGLEKISKDSAEKLNKLLDQRISKK